MKVEEGTIWVVVEDFLPGWTARFSMSKLIKMGIAQVDEMRIVPTDAPLGQPSGPVPGITSRVIRAVPIGAVAHVDLSEFVLWPFENASADDEDTAEGERKRGRQRMDDLLLAHTAKLYTAAMRDPRTRRSPARAVAEELKVERGTIRYRLNQARARGFLTATEKGRQGGQLTPTARKVLRRAKRRQA